jgi:hypothetical protein
LHRQNPPQQRKVGSLVLQGWVSQSAMSMQSALRSPSSSMPSVQETSEQAPLRQTPLTPQAVPSGSGRVQS